MCVYRCVKSKKIENTVHVQQLRYFRRINRNICPIKAFAIGFGECLQLSLQKGFELIVCLDDNENMKFGKLARVFRSLGLLETTDVFCQGPEQPTFHEGRHQIDAT